MARSTPPHQTKKFAVTTMLRGVRFDPGLWFTLAMCLFAVLPVLAHPGLFVGHDTLNHAFRVGELARQWSNGVILPRWAEPFYAGYGSPVFQYYAPLTYYLSAGFMRLFGLDAAGAMRLLVIVCLPTAGAGMYLFMRAYAGRLAGILAALTYVYSPYLVFTEPVTRGDYPELLCFALFPFVMWRVEGLLHAGRGRDLAWAALVVGVFALAHNLMSVLLLALLIGWLVWRRLFGDITWAQLRRVMVGVGLGVGLSLYFWLPIVLEHHAIQLANVPDNIQSEQAHFFGFFVPLDRLLAPSPLADAGAANGTLLRLNLGVAQWGLALTGLLGVIVIKQKRLFTTETQRTQRENQENIGSSTNQLSSLSPQSSVLSPLFFALAALVMVVLMLPLAAWVWASVAALNFLEFPWRLLGPVALCLALLAGLNAVWIERLPARAAGIVTAGLVALPALLALPTLYVPAERLTNLDTSPAAYLEAELSGQTSPGTSARNDFLPVGVKVLPGATQSLLDDYADGGPVNKVNPLSIPADSQATLVESTAQADTWDVHAAAPFTLELMTFYFNGWTAEIDGQPVPIRGTQPHGFIRINLPVGDHTLRVFLAETPARWLGAAATLVSLAVTVVLVRRMNQKNTFSPQRSQRTQREDQENTLDINNDSLLNRQRLKPSGYPTDKPTKGAGWGGATSANQTFSDTDTHHDSLITHYSLLITAFVVTTGLVALLMRAGVAWVQSPPGEARLAQHQTVYNLGESIQVLGYDVSAEAVRPGDWLEVVVYWYTQEPINGNYSSFVHFADGDRPLAGLDRPLPGGLLTSEWRPGAYYRDAYSLRIPGEVAPGAYRINLGLYTCDTRPAGACGNGDRLAVTDADGNALGDILPLGTVRVSP